MFTGSRLLTTDLVECEEKVVLACQLGWQLNLYFLVKFRLSGETMMQTVTTLYMWCMPFIYNGILIISNVAIYYLSFRVAEEPCIFTGCGR